MYGDIGVFGCGGDGELKGDEREERKKGDTYGVPLEVGYFRYLDEEPLSGNVLEALF